MMADDGWKPLTPKDFADELAKDSAPTIEPSPEPEPEVTGVRSIVDRSIEERLRAAQEMGLARNILKQLAFIGPRSKTIEIQVLGLRRYQNSPTEMVKAVHASSDDKAVELCTEADSWSSHGIYFLPAKLRAGVETRHAATGKWFDLGKGGGTTDNDVEARLILAIDFDVKRSAGISATDEELQRSVRIATRAWEFLAGALSGTDSLALLHSGNGRQIHLALDSLTTDDESKNLCATILAGMGALFSTGEVNVDRNLFDAKRILPACGTLKKKGAPGIEERPHRRTAIVTPDVVKRLSLQDLVLLSRTIYATADDAGKAAMYAAAGKRPTTTSNVSPLTPSKDSPFGRANGVPTSEVASWLGIVNNQGDAVCPGCGNTKGVSLLSVGLKCFHNTCASKGVPGKPGFRTNVDLVMEARNMTNVEAVKVLGDRFGFDGTVGPQEPTRETQGQMQTPPLPAYSATPISTQTSSTESRWKIWTPEEIYADIPPIDWLVEGIIPKATVGLLAAYGSSLKSWAELDLLDSIACGKPWLGRFKCAQGKSFLIDYESGSYEVRRRLQSIARGRRMLDAVQGLGFVSFPPDFLTTAAFITEVTRIAETHSLIAIDTLAAGSPGADENDSRFAAPLNLLKGISEKTGCSFLVLHHTRKTRDGEDEREGTRGSSAIFNALDYELKLFKFKSDGSFTCKQTKARQGKKIDPFLVRILEPTPDAIIVASEMASEAQAEPTPAAEFSDLKKEILAVVATTPGISGVTSVQERVKKRRSSVATAIRELLVSGLLLQPDGVDTPFFVMGGVGSQTGTGSQVPAGTGSAVPPLNKGEPVGTRGGGDLFATTPPPAAPTGPTKLQVQRAVQAESDATTLELVTVGARRGFMVQQGWGATRKESARAVLGLWETTAKDDAAELAEWRKQGLNLMAMAEREGWLADTKNAKRFDRAKALLPPPSPRIAAITLNESEPSRAKPEEPPLPGPPAPGVRVAEVIAAPVAAAAATPATGAAELDVQAERDADALMDLFPKEQKELMKDWSKERRWRARAVFDAREAKPAEKVEPAEKKTTSYTLDGTTVEVEPTEVVLARAIVEVIVSQSKIGIDALMREMAKSKGISPKRVESVLKITIEDGRVQVEGEGKDRVFYVR